jgi:hypothetical protein
MVMLWSFRPTRRHWEPLRRSVEVIFWWWFAASAEFRRPRCTVRRVRSRRCCVCIVFVCYIWQMEINEWFLLWMFCLSLVFWRNIDFLTQLKRTQTASKAKVLAHHVFIILYEVSEKLCRHSQADILNRYYRLNYDIIKYTAQLESVENTRLSY